MRVVLLGATSPTGWWLVRELQARGHRLVIVVPDPARAAGAGGAGEGGLGVVRRCDPAPWQPAGPTPAVVGTNQLRGPDRPGVPEIHYGCIDDHAVLAGALAGRPDAVVSVVEPHPTSGTSRADLAAALRVMMPDAGVRRFVALSGAGVAVRGDRRAPRDRAVKALMRRWGGAAVPDQQCEYDLWSVSDLHWTLIRAPRLSRYPPHDSSRGARGACAVDDVVEHHAHRAPRRTSISRATLARFLVDVLERRRYIRQAPLVARR